MYFSPTTSFQPYLSNDVNSETGRIFADGNLASTHDAFTADHSCNRFCKFFHLEPFDDNSLGRSLPQQKLFTSQSQSSDDESPAPSSQHPSLPQRKLLVGLSQPIAPKASSTRRSADEMVISIRNRGIVTPSLPLPAADKLPSTSRGTTHFLYNDPVSLL
jgi:hypothetical protein